MIVIILYVSLRRCVLKSSMEGKKTIKRKMSRKIV